MLGAAKRSISRIYRIITALRLFQFAWRKAFLIFRTVPYSREVPTFLAVRHRRQFRTGCFFGGHPDTRPEIRAARPFHTCPVKWLRLFHHHFPKEFLPLLNGGVSAIMLCFSSSISPAPRRPWSLECMRRKKG